ncbi:hypothetical protein RZ68_03710 [[Haemophilus] ducreyi]|uniref:glycosyltransferase n=1 Tax=Haemophilus ducreyi TaxID=730 RepID=UPI00065568DB|nr:hypothetical protein RZ68_03710 [[Haemophilus] ducreyi]
MLNPLEKMNIVLAANQSYSEYILTTIKSICLHNKHIRFYLLNRDYPTEWFDILNNKLRKLNSEIIDIKVTNDTIKNFKTYSHISSDTTFFGILLVILLSTSNHMPKIASKICSFDA